MSRWEQQLASNLPLLSAVAAAAFALRSRMRPAIPRWTSTAGSGESALGEGLHRGVFRVIGAMPAPISTRIRRGVFDTRFRWDADPWQYEDLPYEIRKRQELLRHMPRDATTVLEIGCAEGHNLRALAALLPEARIIGIDVSARAVQLAGQRARSAGLAIEAIQTDVRRAPDALRDRKVPSADVVVIAETLYYLGNPERIARELRPLGSTLAPGTTVVLLHPVRDAQRLHDAAFAALGATRATTDAVADPVRPFVVETAVTG